MTAKQVSKKAQSILESFEELKCALEELRDEAQCYFDDRSEKWQDSEKGEAFQELIDNLESAVSDADSFTDALMSLMEDV